MKKVEKEQNVRFTTLINPTLLSQLKLISYFTNTKLYEKVNHSVSLAILEFEKTHNTNIDSLIIQCKQRNLLPPLKISKYYPQMKNTALVCITEMNSKNSIEEFLQAAQVVLNKRVEGERL